MTTLATTPLFERLRGSQRVLLAGAGGGFDVYAAMPLYLSLQAMGVEVHLANLSFTDLALTDAPEVCEGLRRVRADTMGAHGYFPEKWLCRWLAARSLSVPEVRDTDTMDATSQVIDAVHRRAPMRPPAAIPH